MKFKTDYESILEKLNEVDPMLYGKTRNYVNGAVTYLSPYISRGVISTRQVLHAILAKGYSLPEIESFVKELCWRDYFQRVGQERNLNSDIKQAQAPVSNHEVPSAIVEASTGIAGIDDAIQRLYDYGYMHNHCRMYTASVVCNVARSHWRQPALWMYYHLLDGDWASNACSWQWVAGANSSKKYYANQENINKFCSSSQVNTFLDASYEAIEIMEIPASLLATEQLMPKTELPVTAKLKVDNSLPTFIYNYYNLDPLWHKGEQANRILLLEPNFFSLYPVSEKCIRFMMDLSKNIPGIQVYTGSFESMRTEYNLNNIFYKEHPLNNGYKGTEESRDWIAETVTGYYPSFFSYWKKIEKVLKPKISST